MLKTLRVIAAAFLIALLFYAANLAVRDCRTGPFHYDNCLWLRVRDRLGLPQSSFLRGVVLEGVGLAILAGIVLAARLAFPSFGRKSLSQTTAGKNASGPPTEKR